ncbi:MAG TPA: hypothetical protein VFR02_07710 [bacterium]|nr:hypothetical protein [bacterium]
MRSGSFPARTGLALALLTAPAAAFAADNGGLNPAAYWDLCPGGSPSAMGGAAEGMRGDLAGAFYNPAGLAGLEGTEVQVGHAALSLGRSLNYLAVGASYQEKYHFGLALLAYSDGSDLQARSGPSVAPDAVFSDLALSVLASLAFPLGPDWDLGVSARVLTQAFGLADLPTGFGLGEDLALQYHPTADQCWGLTLSNALADFLYSDGTDAPLPADLRLGLSQAFPDLDLKGALDLDWRTDLGPAPHVGLEWRPVESLAFQGGYWVQLDGGEDGIGFGASLSLGLSGGVRTDLGYSVSTDRLLPGSLTQQLNLRAHFL